jgi:fermentation-respiration switch protein FrsA (DUF1100 family)
MFPRIPATEAVERVFLDDDLDAVGALAIVCFGLLTWGANRMLYYPMKYPAGDWSVQDGLGAKDVWIYAGDGTKLHGWWITAPAQSASLPRFATLHLHGNGGNITHRALSARNILSAGSSVLLLDYRGYGKSEGKPSEEGLYQDADAAYEWIVAQGYAPARIIIHGESLGTPVAVHLTTRRNSAGLVMEAAFTSARAVAGRVLPVIGPLLVSGYNTIGRIKKVRVPLLIIHGDRDEVIAYEFGQELFRAANDPKSFWTIPGATHNDLHTIGKPEFRARLAAFYNSLSANQVPESSKGRQERH